MKKFTILSCVLFFSVLIIFPQRFVCGKNAWGTAGEWHTAEQPPYHEKGSFQFKTLEFRELRDITRKNRQVPIKVYYPEKPGAYPLIIISHGAIGTWDSHIYQAEHLASHGYVVFCVEHVRSNNIMGKYYMSRRGGRLKILEALQKMTTDPQAVLERPRDITFAIDQAIKWNRNQNKLAGKIKTDKIAVMGHSFGAYTTLVVCGAQPILDYLEPRVAPGTGLAGDLSDPRVTFGLAMSPQTPGTTFFGKESYTTINRPLVCITGSKDTQKSHDGKKMPANVRWEVLKMLPKGGGHYFFWLTNANHLSFADSPFLQRLPSRAKRDVPRITRALMVLFSDYFLKDDRNAMGNLTKGYIDSLCGSVVSKISWFTK
jgi:predicted dienelactone hydrolase